MNPKKMFQEDLAKILESPNRQALRELIQNHFGETDQADFKAEWPAVHKVAKHVLALANSGGGVIVFGLKELEDGAVSVEGLSRFTDQADLGKRIGRYLPNALAWDLLSVAYTESEYADLRGKKIQLLAVDSIDRCLPFVCQLDGDGVRRGAIYVRRNTESVAADYDELQAVLNRRIESGYSSATKSKLAKQLDDLQELYAAKPHQMAVMIDKYSNPVGRSSVGDLNSFIRELIEETKGRIRATLRESHGVSEDT